MKYTHSQTRASERYYINNFNPKFALTEILNDKCVQIKEDYEKYSRTFLIKYFNKYVVIVTDYNVNFVKTCLPFGNQLDYLNELLEKLNRYDTMAA